MMRVLLSLLLVAAALAGSAAAQEVPAAAGSAAAPQVPAPPPANPYSATVPVAGTSDAQRNAAIADALAQVMQQVSPGSSPDPDTLSQAAGYVRDFRYRRAPSGAGLELQVDFDPGAVRRLVAAGSAVSPGSAGTGVASASSVATPAAPSGPARVWVAGIDDSHAFATLLSTLRADSALRDVTPIGAQGDGVLLQLKSDQPLDVALASLTGPAGHLAVEPLAHPGADATLRWIP